MPCGAGNESRPDRLVGWEGPLAASMAHAEEDLSMQIGAVLPQTEIGTDQASIRDYVQAMQDLGYQHIVTSDHVVGANPGGPPGWPRPQNHKTVVHEPFVLFGFIAGAAPKL